MFDKLIDVLLDFIELFKFWEVLDEWEEGVILTLGRPRDRHKPWHLWKRRTTSIGPGLHWILPFAIEEVVSKSVALNSHRMRAQRITNKNNESVAVSVACLWKVKDSRKLILEVETDEEVMYDSVFCTTSELVRNSTWAEMITPEWHAELQRKIRVAGRAVGIDVVKTSMTDMVKLDFMLGLENE